MSKLILFDFACIACDAKFEELIDPGLREIACPQCGGIAKRLISPVRIDQLGMAASGDGFESANDYFVRVHRERKAIEEKSYAEHGDYGTQSGSDGGSFTPEGQADF